MPPPLSEPPYKQAQGPLSGLLWRAHKRAHVYTTLVPRPLFEPLLLNHIATEPYMGLKLALIPFVTTQVDDWHNNLNKKPNHMIQMLKTT